MYNQKQIKIKIKKNCLWVLSKDKMYKLPLFFSKKKKVRREPKSFSSGSLLAFLTLGWVPCWRFWRICN